jgi:hypothetical protein
MNFKLFRVGVVEPSHAEEITQLRIRSYRLSSSFSWFDETALHWNEVDRNSAVLGVFNERNLLVSTVRASIRVDRFAIDLFLMYSTKNVPTRLPALIGSRSATHADYAKVGLAAAMRWVIVRNSLRLQLGSITGVVYDNAPRVRSMMSHGYEFFDAPEQWDDEATVLAKPIIISMPASAFSNAVHQIELEAAKVLSDCEFDEPAITAAFDQEAARAGIAAPL